MSKPYFDHKEDFFKKLDGFLSYYRNSFNNDVDYSYEYDPQEDGFEIRLQVWGRLFGSDDDE